MRFDESPTKTPATMDTNMMIFVMTAVMAAMTLHYEERLQQAVKPNYKHQYAYAKRLWATDPAYRAKKNDACKAAHNRRMQSDSDYAERVRAQARMRYHSRKGILHEAVHKDS